MKWSNTTSLAAIDFTCGYCDREISSVIGYFDQDSGQHQIYICPRCNKPSYFDYGEQNPGVAPGKSVEHVPKELHELYDEARRSMAANAPTAAVLTCRKLLMNIAVQKGAKEGLSFIKYVEYLAEKNYVPPGGDGWVNHIRKKGNEANHEIALMDSDDAKELITFAEMLLKFIFEFPARVPSLPNSAS